MKNQSIPDRIWFRHIFTGERGYLEQTADGKDQIRLDRPKDPYAVRKMSSDWARDDTVRPLTTAQLAQVAFAADLSLCRALGDHKLAKRQWIELDDLARIGFIEFGPVPDHDEHPRQKLWGAIMGALKGISA